MSFDPHSWIVTERVLEFPDGHVLYRAERDVSPEFPLPTTGTNAGTLLGSNYNGLTVTSAGRFARANRKIVYFEFSGVPSTHVEYESMGYVFPALYPSNGRANFPGGSAPRSRVVPARVTYEYASGTPPTSWLTAAATSPTATGGPFEPRSYIAAAAATVFEGQDGNSYRVGQWLVGAFINQNTLNDHIDIDLQAPYSLEYDLLSSTPSHATYDSWITSRTRIMADRVIRKWRGRIYQRITREVVAQ